MFKYFIAVGLIVIPTLALSHGDAEWIQNNPKYVMENGFTHCCGPEHCGRAKPGEFVEEQYGIRHIRTGKLFKYRLEDGKVAPGQYLSIDQDWWWCWNYSWDYTGNQQTTEDEAKVPLCVFRPYSGS